LVEWGGGKEGAVPVNEFIEAMAPWLFYKFSEKQKYSEVH